MTPVTSDGRETDAGEYWGGSGALVTVADACVHAHMPRRRKSRRPHRASGGSGSPSAARRNRSYWAAMLGASTAGTLGVAALIAAFFFRPGLARWSWGAPRD